MTTKGSASRRPVSSPAKARKAASRSGPARKHILLVDDHPMTRAGLAQLINKQPDLEVCCEARDPAQALSKVSQARPDLILTDLTMPGRSGTEFIKDVLALHPGLPILVVSMHDELLYAEHALRAGARGYIMKEAGGERILAGIRRLLEGEVYVSERMSSRLLDSLTGRRPRGSHAPITALSEREFEVFHLIGEGKSTREIAAELHLSPKTVDVHRGHIKEKLSLKNATALLRYAVRWCESSSSAGP